MKKGLLLLSLFMILMCSGCYVTGAKELLKTGVWYDDVVSEVIYNSNSKYGEDYIASTLFKKVKVELKEITKEEYDNANGANVFIDSYTMYNDEKRYMQIKLYLVPVESDDYILSTISDLEYKVGNGPYTYSNGIFKINIDDTSYEGSCRISFSNLKGVSSSADICIELFINDVKLFITLTNELELY